MFDWSNITPGQAGQAAGLLAGAAAGGPGGAATGQAAGALLGGAFGPGYTPGGGGEVRRQLANWPPAVLELYLKWLSEFQPATYESGDVWDASPNCSLWYDRYCQARDWVRDEANQPVWIEGQYTLDAQLNPIPMTQTTATGKGGAPGGKSGGAQAALPPGSPWYLKLWAWVKDNTVTTLLVVGGVVVLLMWKPWKKKVVYKRKASSGKQMRTRF